jgi:hypothetical protein
MVKEKRPTILFLMETKVRNSTMQKIQTSLGFEGLLTVESIGKSGGLALLWKDNREVSIQNFSLSHISAKVCFLGSDSTWQLTCFYGNSNVALRGESWKLLTYLSRITSLSWLCVGDFNEILNN